MTEIYILITMMFLFCITMSGCAIYILKHFMDNYRAMIKADNDAIADIDNLRTMRGDIYSDSEIKMSKFNLKEDFDNNIVPIIDKEVRHFITYKFMPNLDKSVGNGQLPSDTFVKNNIEDFVTPVLMNVSVAMKKYFTKYMPPENFERYIAATAYNDLLIACAEFERKYKKNK